MRWAFLTKIRQHAKASLPALLCAGLLAAQTTLPVLHGAHAAAEESAVHRFDPRPDETGAITLERDVFHPGHSHHDPEPCPIHQLFAKGRWVAFSATNAHSIFIPEAASFSVGRHVFVPEVSELSGASPRAPPVL